MKRASGSLWVATSSAKTAFASPGRPSRRASQPPHERREDRGAGGGWGALQGLAGLRVSSQGRERQRAQLEVVGVRGL